jgi:hypothetical protein
MKRLLMLACLPVFIGSCYNDKGDKLYPALPTNTCDTSVITYTKDIQPIINASCAISGGCHNAAGNATTGGLDYTVFSILQAQATPDLIIADINHTPTKGHNSMPLNLPKLPQCDINKMTRWVNEGAPNN